MFSRLSRHVRRTALAALLAAPITPTAYAIEAEPAEPAVQIASQISHSAHVAKIVPVTDFPTSCPIELADTEELCGWGTHDTAPYYRIASRKVAAEKADLSQQTTKPASAPEVITEFSVAEEVLLDEATEDVAVAELEKPEEIAVAQRIDSEAATPAEPQSDESVPSVAASVAAAAVGVRVQQIIEPFAMVGNKAQSSLEQLRTFADWWEQIAAVPIDQDAVANVDSAIASPVSETTNEVDQLIVDLAMSEPVDIEHISINTDNDSVTKQLESTSEVAAKIETQAKVQSGTELTAEPVFEQSDADSDGIEVTQIQRHIGSGPIIATIQEDYLPYDLSDSDLQLWSVLPLNFEPFCVRSESRAARFPELLNEDELLAKARKTESKNSEEKPAAIASLSDDEEALAACQFDELVASILDQADKHGVTTELVLQSLTLQNVGSIVADIANRSVDATAVAVETIASKLPANFGNAAALAVGQLPAAKNPAAKNPAAKNPAANNPAANNPVANNPVANNPVANNPVAKKTAAAEDSDKENAGRRLLTRADAESTDDPQIEIAAIDDLIAEESERDLDQSQDVLAADLQTEKEPIATDLEAVEAETERIAEAADVSLIR